MIRLIPPGPDDDAREHAARAWRRRALSVALWIGAGVVVAVGIWSVPRPAPRPYSPRLGVRERPATLQQYASGPTLPQAADRTTDASTPAPDEPVASRPAPPPVPPRASSPPVPLRPGVAAPPPPPDDGRASRPSPPAAPAPRPPEVETRVTQAPPPPPPPPAPPPAVPTPIAPAPPVTRVAPVSPAAPAPPPAASGPPPVVAAAPPVVAGPPPAAPGPPPAIAAAPAPPIVAAPPALPPSVGSAPSAPSDARPASPALGGQAPPPPPPPPAPEPAGSAMVRGAPPAGAPAGASIASADERAVGASAAPIAPPRVARRGAPEPVERRPPGRPAAMPAPAALAQGVRRALVTVRAPGRRGTGFVVDSQGYVVTSAQVVNGGGAIEVTLHDGRTVPVSVVGRDRLTGVALLKVEAGRLPAIALGSSSGLRVGDAVVAVGGRRGDRPDLAVGTLRGTGVATGGDLALDIPVAPGGGGGPLLDARGEVVGVTTAGAGTGSAGAVPIDRVKPVLRQLRAGPPAPGARPPVPSDR